MFVIQHHHEHIHRASQRLPRISSGIAWWNCQYNGPDVARVRRFSDRARNGDECGKISRDVLLKIHHDSLVPTDGGPLPNVVRDASELGGSGRKSTDGRRMKALSRE